MDLCHQVLVYTTQQLEVDIFMLQIVLIFTLMIQHKSQASGMDILAHMSSGPYTLNPETL